MSQQAATGEAQAEAAAAASGSAPPAASEQQEQEDSLLGQQRFATTGFQHAGWLAKATYTFVAPLLRRGAQNQVQCGVGDAGRCRLVCCRCFFFFFFFCLRHAGLCLISAHGSPVWDVADR